jgi:hypothetical protein
LRKLSKRQRGNHLWSYDDVARESDAILDRVRDGSMPCDGAWDEQRVALFQQWIDGGKAA